MIHNFDQPTRKALSRAVGEGRPYGYVGPEHLMIAVSPVVGGKFRPLASQFAKHLQIITGVGGSADGSDERPPFTDAAKQTLEKAASESRARGYTSYPAQSVVLAALAGIAADTEQKTPPKGYEQLYRLLTSMSIDMVVLYREIVSALDRGAPEAGGSKATAPPENASGKGDSSQWGTSAATGPAAGSRSDTEEADSGRRRPAASASDDAAGRDRHRNERAPDGRSSSSAPREQRPESGDDESDGAGTGGGSALENYASNLTAEALAGELDPVIGRDDEIENIQRVLGRKKKNNPVIVGEAGVGKTAIVEGLASRIAHKEAPARLSNCRIYAVDVAGLIAGAKYRGEFEERLNEMVAEATADPRVILFVDEIHSLVGAGSGEGSMDAASILKAPLARGKLRLIGATTIDEYRRYIEKDAALERRFQKVQADEPSASTAIEVLTGLKSRYESHHAVGIPSQSIEQAVRLAERYIPDRRLPDKAIDVIDEAASAVAGASANAAALAAASAVASAKVGAAGDSAESRHGQIDTASGLAVGPEDVCAVVSAWTGIPVGKLSGEQTQVLRNLESILAERIVGQREAIAAIAPCVRRALAGMADPARPTGSFLFLGPTGVGKTELARALAEQLFASSEAFIKVDMSEYTERHTTSRLIGSPPGYIGHESPGLLTEKVRRHPYSIVLFDEIEKAHDEVANLLLQILEDGKLTDAQNREVDFTNTVVIMTSNIGAEELMQTKVRQRMGFSGAAEGTGPAPADDTQKEAAHVRTRAKVLETLKSRMKPEIIGRIDESIVFANLSAQELRQIAALQAERVSERLAERGVALHFSERALDAISKIGEEEGSYGARPIRRRVRRFVEQPMSDLILDGGLTAGEGAYVLDRLALESLRGSQTRDSQTRGLQANVADLPRVFSATAGDESPVLIAAAELEDGGPCAPPDSDSSPGAQTEALEETVLAALGFGPEFDQEVGGGRPEPGSGLEGGLPDTEGGDSEPAPGAIRPNAIGANHGRSRRSRSRARPAREPAGCAATGGSGELDDYKDTRYANAEDLDAEGTDPEEAEVVNGAGASPDSDGESASSRPSRSRRRPRKNTDDEQEAQDGDDG